MSLSNDISRVLLDEQQLATKIKELGETLTKEYSDKNPILVCILKGSTVFYADLVRHMDCNLQFDFLIASSYEGTESTRVVNIKKDLANDIKGRHVVLVEDIIDSGNTLYYVKKILNEREPASLKIVTLLNKEGRREVDIEADWFGYDIPDEFVVGFGLDYNEKYRNLPYVAILKKEIYS